MTTSVQWRAFIGPRWRTATEAGADLWTQIAAGTLTPQADTTLAATLSDGATSASLAAASTWPSANGWAYIGPNGSGEAWEYISYTTRSSNTISGITREASAGREHNGTHTSGAAARLFWPLTTDNGQLTVNIEANADLSAETWTAQISGVTIPPVAIRNNHLILIQTREDPADAWQVFLCGWIQAPRTRDDYQRRGDWAISIVPAARLIGEAQTDGIRAGAIDLARHGSASSDTPLAYALREITSGDFVAADPGLEAGNVIDGDPNTLWIAERVKGTPDTAGFISPFDLGFFFSQLYLVRQPGDTRPSRWLEYFCGNQTLSRMELTNGNKKAVSVGFNNLACKFGDRLIFCEDRATFEADHPLAKPARIFQIGSQWFNDIRTAGDAICWYNPNGGTWTGRTFAWGDGYDHPTRDADDGGDGPDWVGAKVTAPQPGQVMRYYYTAGQTWAYTQYRTDYLDHAGYAIDDGTDPWIIVTLPGLGLIIDADMTAGSPAAGATLRIVDESGGATTGGLPSSGTIQIALEQISYSSKSDAGIVISARGANSTTAAAHAKGDRVYVVDSTGTATDGQPIREITWRRRAGGSVPARFYLYRSGLETVRNPSQSGYGNDYEELASVSNHSAATYTITLSPPRRTRHVLLQFEYMTTNPGRPRLNELEAYINESAYGTATWISGSPSAAAMIAQVLINAGLPSAAITQSSGTATITGFTTAKDKAWRVAVDLADYAGAYIAQPLTGLITIQPNTLWTAASLTPASTFSRSNAKAIEISQILDMSISQVIVNWRTPDNSASGQEKYPATPLTVGAPVELDEAIFANAGAAQNAAKRRFLQGRYQYQIAIECAEGKPTIRPGAVYTLDWQLAEDMQPIQRTAIVTAVDHQIANGQFATVLTCIQSERESYT